MFHSQLISVIKGALGIVLLKHLTHWGRVTHICVNKITIIGSDNGLSPGRRQAIIWTNAGILIIWRLGTNFSEIIIEIDTFSLKKIHLKMSSGKWRPFYLGLNWRRVNHEHGNDLFSMINTDIASKEGGCKNQNEIIQLWEFRTY